VQVLLDDEDAYAVVVGHAPDGPKEALDDLGGQAEAELVDK
jgi:hypothetical protein